MAIIPVHRPDGINHLARTIALADNAVQQIARFCNMILGRVRKPAEAGAACRHDRREWLIDFVRDRGRPNPPR